MMATLTPQARSRWYMPLLALLLAVSAVFTCLPALAAEPSLHEVYQAAESGRLNEAQAMMEQVLRDHPNSAKAHFVEAEILTKQGQFSRARNELAQAERLQPGLPFAKPEAVASLKTRLMSTAPAGVGTPLPATVPPSGGFPWGTLIIGVGVAAMFIFLVRLFLNRNPPVQVVPAPGGPYPGGSYGGNAPVPGGPAPYGGNAWGAAPPAAGGGVGSGILGGLATGAAMGAGIVAGEALMHRVLDGGEGHAAHAAPVPTYDPPPPADYNMGGNDFGVSDSGSWDDGGSSGGGDSDWS